MVGVTTVTGVATVVIGGSLRVPVVITSIFQNQLGTYTMMPPISVGVVSQAHVRHANLSGGTTRYVSLSLLNLHPISRAMSHTRRKSCGVCLGVDVILLPLVFIAV